MFKKVKEYFEMKRLERQMKYALLSHLYLFVDEKDNYLRFFRSLVNEVDYTKFHEDLIYRISEFAHAEAVKERELAKENEDKITEK